MAFSPHKIQLPFLVFILFMGCQQRPGISPAAFPDSNIKPAPMGSEINNKHLKAQLTNLSHGPQYEWESANIYFSAHRFIESARLFTKVLDKEPENLEARSKLARSFFFLGSPERGLLELETLLLSKQPQSHVTIEALFFLGTMTSKLEKPTPNQLRKGLGAFDTYLKIAKQSPHEASIHEAMAEMQEKLGEPSPAPKSRGKAATSPKNAGIAAFLDGDLLGAETLIELSLQKAPEDPQLQTYLARIFMQSGRQNKAYSLFKNIIKKHPRYEPGFHYKGMAHMMRGEIDQAIASWQSVIALSPSYADEFNLKARIAIAKTMLN